MPSTAKTQYLEPLLSDVGDLVGAHATGSTGTAGRQWHLAGLNRSIVVMSVSAWEAYAEQVVIEAVELLRPQLGGQLGVWPALMASTRSAVGRFNTPNPQNVRGLVDVALGLPDIHSSWSWARTKPENAWGRLEAVVALRHRIAHGVHPRPTVHHRDARRLPDFFRNLASCTDTGITAHLGTMGVATGW